MRSKNHTSFVRHIDACGYGDNGRPMDEDDALEQAEEEIRRLKLHINQLEKENAELIAINRKLNAIK